MNRLRYSLGMERIQGPGTRIMETLIRTGYPVPINLFVAIMLLLLPVVAPLAGTTDGEMRSAGNYLLAGAISLTYLVVWSRLRVYNPQRSTRFIQTYLTVQTVLVSLIYVLDGGLTRFLFVVVAVQAAYVAPVRRWAPFLGTLGTLWLTLYLVLSPDDPGSSRVAIIGMYLCYLVFAAVVTFTTVQQEEQVRSAQTLLEAVEQRHQFLRIYDQSVEQAAEVEERERLARTIYAALQGRLVQLLRRLELLESGQAPLERSAARGVRLLAKEVMAEVRQAVQTLRPDDMGDLDDQDRPDVGEELTGVQEPRIFADPLQVYHVWNLGVIVITIGVMVASDLVGGTARWLPLVLLGLALLVVYGGAALIREPRLRTLLVVMQAGIGVWFTYLSEEPLMSHIQMIVAAQIVFLVPMKNRWLLAAVLFPTLLTGAVLWSTNLFMANWRVLVSLTLAFGVTYFFAGVMAFMTRRQIEARQEALHYTTQVTQVNRLLEARLQEVHRMAVSRERIRMAREIHDSWGHHLTMAIVELQFAEELALEDPRAAKQHMSAAISVVKAALESGTEMVHALERFDRPLRESIEELVQKWQAGNGARVLLRVQDDLAALPTSARITLYRVVQESLTNIQKHAQAREVQIEIGRQRDRVWLTVVNDHSGGPTADESVRGGFGLMGLRERTSALHGEFSAVSRPDGGFEVRVVLPLGA